MPSLKSRKNVAPARPLAVRKNDTVFILSGKEAGKKGKILRVNKERQTVVVEHLNMVKRHGRAAKDTPAGIIEKEAAIHRSNVMVVCPHCNTPSRIKHSRTAKGKSLRTCHRCSEHLDKG